MKTICAVLFVLIVAYVQAEQIILSCTQDFAVVNSGYGGARISTANELSFFNNGFTSSLSYFGFDVSPLLAVQSTGLTLDQAITTATLVFNNYTTLTNDGVAIPITLSVLNPGQQFSDQSVTINTVPTIQTSLGTVSFGLALATPLDVRSQLITNYQTGGMFGFAVAKPGGPIVIASHRADPEAVQIIVEYSLVTSAPTTTVAPEPTTTVAPGTPVTTTSTPVTTTATPSSPTTTSAPGTPVTTTAAPATTTLSPGAPTTTAAPGTPTTTAAPGTPGVTTTRSSVTTTSAPGTPTTTAAPGTPTTTAGTTTTAAPGTTTTTNPVVTTTLAPGLATTLAPGQSSPAVTTTTSPERSSGIKTELSLVSLLVPIIVALIL
ncbi:cell wall adhesin protein [Acrasis kona]|uniref:Cell wall adhesin protein n=1 Tax=Acrasis kona TaxID=1008807 RepID=A0AAW2Z4L9_9EUKA